VKYPNPPADMAARFSELYDGEIAYLDEHIGRLIDGLRSRGLYESTLIVLTSDHGEEFHEHGGWWHGTTLYDEQIAVPLIVKPVGAVARGQAVPGMATSLDIVPTIAAATGASPAGPVQGQPLPFTTAVPIDRAQVFAEEDFEGNVLQAVRTAEWKLMTANAGNPRGLAEVELYEVAADPRERENLAAGRGPQVEEMRAALGRSVLEARSQEGQGAETEIDSVTKDRLKALGYLE
jgi:arylsulfatase A-like enzyme